MQRATRSSSWAQPSRERSFKVCRRPWLASRRACSRTSPRAGRRRLGAPSQWPKWQRLTRSQLAASLPSCAPRPRHWPRCTCRCVSATAAKARLMSQTAQALRTSPSQTVATSCTARCSRHSSAARASLASLRLRRCAEASAPTRPSPRRSRDSLAASSRISSAVTLRSRRTCVRFCTSRPRERTPRATQSKRCCSTRWAPSLARNLRASSASAAVCGPCLQEDCTTEAPPSRGASTSPAARAGRVVPRAPRRPPALPAKSEEEGKACQTSLRIPPPRRPLPPAQPSGCGARGCPWPRRASGHCACQPARAPRTCTIASCAHSSGGATASASCRDAPRRENPQEQGVRHRRRVWHCSRRSMARHTPAVHSVHASPHGSHRWMLPHPVYAAAHACMTLTLRALVAACYPRQHTPVQTPAPDDLTKSPRPRGVQSFTT
mmetsp:Transcript_138/g.545  ORF Transcript_138/g.545 Transcript_138/m.545 type:complete len:436 (-) Transcript_138:110-1417(-)